jgi:hypothetical protein
MAEREPTMEEIVVALRETKRRADHTLPLALVGQSRVKRPLPGLIGSTDAVGLRDEEMERLLAENARLNARVVALLKIIEQEEAKATEAARDDRPTELDQEAIGSAVKAAVKAELGPLLDLLLHVLTMGAANPVSGIESMSRKPARAGASDWIVDLMDRLEGDAGAPQESGTALDLSARRSKLRERLTGVINAFRLDPYPPRRFTPPEGPS